MLKPGVLSPDDGEELVLAVFFEHDLELGDGEIGTVRACAAGGGGDHEVEAQELLAFEGDAAAWEFEGLPAGVPDQPWAAGGFAFAGRNQERDDASDGEGGEEGAGDPLRGRQLPFVRDGLEQDERSKAHRHDAGDRER